MRVTKKIRDEQLRRLGEVYKNDGPMLHFSSPFTLLVAVILSGWITIEDLDWFGRIRH